MRIKNNFSGVTLVELLVTLSIMAVLTAIAIPSFSGLAQNLALSGQVNSMNADIRYARSEAMKRGVNVTLCVSPDPLASSPTCSGNDWRTGWIIFVNNNADATFDAGEVLLRRQEAFTNKSGAISALQGGTTILGNLSLTRDGRISAPTANVRILIEFKPNGASQSSKFLCVSTNGRSKAVTLASEC